jgi:hypothetical protein
VREPRPRQRFPEGGLEIYEQRKAGTWKHPGLIDARPTGWKHPRGPVQTNERMLSTGYVVLYQPHFDPMLYFWPVDECDALVRVESLDDEFTLRLVRAMLRDGARFVTTSTMSALTSCAKFYDQAGGYKKPWHEYELDVQKPSKKSRYEMTLALIKEADREAGRK